MKRSFFRPSTIAIILLSLAVIAALAFGVWAYLQYDDYKTNFESKRDFAVTEAVKEQSDLDEEKFVEREKKPNRQFVGPADYGRVTFEYPKTWSVHEATDPREADGVYEAYLHPVVVPPLSEDQRFAVRVIIQDGGVEDALTEYEDQVKEGLLKTSSFSNGDYTGTRLDGQFDEGLRGSAVIFKIRDKTLTVRTDANTFLNDYNNLLKTVEYNK